MKRIIKNICIGLCIFIFIIIIDSIQAMWLNNSPLIKIREDYNGGYYYIAIYKLLPTSSYIF